VDDALQKLLSGGFDTAPEQGDEPEGAKDTDPGQGSDGDGDTPGGADGGSRPTG
jgi:hypothetical protein